MKGGTAEMRLLDFYLPTVRAAKLLHDSQAQPTAACAGVARGLKSVKGLKDAAPLCFWDTRTVVVHDNFRRAQGHAHAARVLDAITHQVHQHP